MRFTLKKAEILRGRKSFSDVITQGVSITEGPIRAFALATEGVAPRLVVGFTVSKRVRKAVERNRAKRYLREAFRIKKPMLLDRLTRTNVALRLVFVFNASLQQPRGDAFKTVADSMERILDRISQQIQRR